MFKKILIANRGEIACRIIKTARKMNISPIVLYSEADVDAQHVRLADEAIFIGPAPASQSYLQIEKIIAVCKERGAEAVHPGYGFLSENLEFAEKLIKAGIAFIGPNLKAIFAMGDKIESKKIARNAGIPTVPGYVGSIDNEETAREIAANIGYPVMIKASAGGGGKGMRIAFTEEDLREGLRAAKSEAKSSFADDRVFIEKYIQKPRHIEIQVLGDKHGNLIHLGERECSIQRRHQKIIEEAPSPIMDEALRQEMGKQALALSREVQYDSAGTVEFIMDQDRSFYFLEMNTRLQVEHPVTEMVTGIDLVEQMIRIAAGERLILKQPDIKFQGSAIEARIYAEDPSRGFLPSIGRLTRYREPASIRVDSGVYEGSDISIYYDPMIAKAISHAQNREEAALKLHQALDRFEIRGLQNNISFLQALLGHPFFLQGQFSTDFIGEEFPDGFQGAQISLKQQKELCAIICVIHQILEERVFVLQPAFANGKRKGEGQWAILLDEKWHKIELQSGEKNWTIRIEDETFIVSTDWQPFQSLCIARIGEAHELAVQIQRQGIGYNIRHGGAAYDVQVMPWRAAELAMLMPVKVKPDMDKFLLSPMPGLLSHLFVKEGDGIKVGQELCVIEAMKMENTIRADHEGKIARLHTSQGQSVFADQIILEFV